jgi:hypothetical protein
MLAPRSSASRILQIKVEPLFDDHTLALMKLKTGEVAALY